MDSLTNLDVTATLALAAAALSLFAVLVTIVTAVRQASLLKRYRRLLNGNAGQDLEAILLAQDATLQKAQHDISSLAEQISSIMASARLHIQRTAIVRFNAFPDTGSDLSFAIALLDANYNGFVLTSLYSRSESRIYAKPIQNGKSTYTLTEEEKEAIAKATGTKPA